MKILVLGGNGFIGSRLLQQLATAPKTCHFSLTDVSRHGATVSEGWTSIRGDCRDLQTLSDITGRVDVVVNCVTGDANTIVAVSRNLVDIAVAKPNLRIVHLSSMAVYGNSTGVLSESAICPRELHWYGQAKRIAEVDFARLALSGGSFCILRPGCVFGAGSASWVRRLGRWLQQGRLGDLGSSGDGWSNLVHVDDVVSAIIASLTYQSRDTPCPIFNLAAPDSPRWNNYLVELGIAIGAQPVKRISSRGLALDSRLISPPLKLAERLLNRLGSKYQLPYEGIPPSLTRLFAQDIRLDSTAATQTLGIKWTPFDQGLKDSANWFNASQKVLGR